MKNPQCSLMQLTYGGLITWQHLFNTSLVPMLQVLLVMMITRNMRWLHLKQLMRSSGISWHFQILIHYMDGLVQDHWVTEILQSCTKPSISCLLVSPVSALLPVAPCKPSWRPGHPPPSVPSVHHRAPRGRHPQRSRPTAPLRFTEPGFLILQ